MQRLMRRLHATGLHPRRHRLTLLRSPGSSSPVQYAFSGASRSAWPNADDNAST